MKELYIIRHAQAEEQADDDETRKLTKKGQKQAKELAKKLKKSEIIFDQILTSPFLRAFETAQILSSKKNLIVSPLLKPNGSFRSLIRYLNKLQGEKIALVGHEPFLSSFASYCLSKSRSSFIDLKKGGIIKLAVSDVLKPGEALLVWLTSSYDQ